MKKGMVVTLTKERSGDGWCEIKNEESKSEKGMKERKNVGKGTVLT
jgi:hypothetical protein